MKKDGRVFRCNLFERSIDMEFSVFCIYPIYYAGFSISLYVPDDYEFGPLFWGGIEGNISIKQLKSIYYIYID